MSYAGQGPNPRTIMKLGGAALLLIISLILLTNLLVHVDQNQIMAIQYPSGHIEWFENGGYHLQWFGKVVKFDRRKQFWFSETDGNGTKVDQQIKVRFNDGGHGDIHGSIAWEMPADIIHLNRLYQKYGSEEAIEHDLIDTVVTKSVTMSGPLMSSKESYSEKKNDLIRYMEDQVAQGVYQTETQEKNVVDPLSGEKRATNVVTIKEKDGQFLRQESSPLQDFGIRTYNLSIKNIVYDQTVEQQIQQQQQAVMQVQTAMAQARQAEQQAITAAKNGEAEAAKAKWEHEVIKARAVTEAQQKLEAARRRAVMQADGALEKKLAAWVQVNQYYADAIKNHPGAWVPQVSMGASGNGGTNAQELINLFTAKAAKDLSLYLGVGK